MTEKCDECGGSGKKRAQATSSGGTIKITCPACKGTGRKQRQSQRRLK